MTLTWQYPTAQNIKVWLLLHSSFPFLILYLFIISLSSFSFSYTTVIFFIFPLLIHYFFSFISFSTSFTYSTAPCGFFSYSLRLKLAASNKAKYRDGVFTSYILFFTSFTLFFRLYSTFFLLLSFYDSHHHIIVFFLLFSLRIYKVSLMAMSNKAGYQDVIFTSDIIFPFS